MNSLLNRDKNRALLFLAGSLAFVWLYLPIMPGWVAQWWNEPDYSHGFLIPLASLLLIWMKREELLASEIEPGPWGVPLIGLAFALYVLGHVGAELFLQRVSMILMVAGSVIFLAGIKIFKVLMFPIGYLLMAVPWPGIIFKSVAFPLQLLAARIATETLQLFFIPALREGNIIHLASISLDVEEACSGIRSLLSLAAVGVLYAYLTEESWLSRTVIVLLVIPIAIAANVFRVTATGFIAHYGSPEAAAGFFHGVGGMSVFVVALVLFFVVSKFLSAAILARRYRRNGTHRFLCLQ